MSFLIGVTACAFSAFLFGIGFLPLRGGDVRDGFFVQWLMTSGIVVFGFIVHALQSFPGFYPFAMIGGALWATANATVIHIMKRIGYAHAVLVCNAVSCLTGWASSYFGFFGMKARPASNPVLNILGVLSVLLGGLFLVQVKSETKLFKEEEGQNEGPNTENLRGENVKKSKSIGGRLLGYILALCAGFFYGTKLVPVVFLQDNAASLESCNKSGCPPGGLPYVFSHFCGIYITGTIIFAIYSISRRGDPYVNSKLVIRSWIVGLIWAMAQSLFFFANEKLTQTVTYPIITMLPGCIATLCGIFILKEIQGRRNLIFMAIATTLTLGGAICVALSLQV